MYLFKIMEYGVAALDILQYYVKNVDIIDHYMSIKNDKLAGDNIIDQNITFEWKNFMGENHRNIRVGRFYFFPNLPACISYKKGVIKVEIWIINGMYHREEGPARLDYYDNGLIYIESWYLMNKLHRINYPATVEYYENGLKSCVSWYMDDEFHRVGYPAVLEYHENGSLKYEEWYRNGKLHRIGNPAFFEYYDNGQLKEKKWYIEGKLNADPIDILQYFIPFPHMIDHYMGERYLKYYLPFGKLWSHIGNGRGDIIIWKNFEEQTHRIDYPAHIRLYESGNILMEKWYYCGKQHREVEPSSIKYFESGKIKRKGWKQRGEFTITQKSSHCTRIKFRENGEITWKEYGKDCRLSRAIFTFLEHCGN